MNFKIIPIFSKLIRAIHFSTNEDDGIEHLHDIPKNPLLKKGPNGFYEVPLQPIDGKNLVNIQEQSLPKR